MTQRWNIFGGAVLAVCLMMLAGCENRKMTLIDGLTQEPIYHALAVIEMQGSYADPPPDPMDYAMAMSQYNRYRKDHHIHGWKNSPPPPMPYRYGRPGYWPRFPEGYNIPDRVVIQTIEPDWEILSFQTVYGPTDIDYQAVMYYFLKPGFIPVMLDPEGVRMLSVKNQVRLVLHPARPGTKASDEQVLHAAGNLLGVVQHPRVSRTGRRVALEMLSDLLSPIYHFETDEPYKGFEDNRAEAKMLIDHIQTLPR